MPPYSRFTLTHPFIYIFEFSRTLTHLYDILDGRYIDISISMCYDPRYGPISIRYQDTLYN